MAEKTLPPPPAPHNIEAEQALLGAILLNNEALNLAGDRVAPEDFFEPLHGKLFELCTQLIRAGKVATPVTITSFLPRDLDIGGMTLAQYIARLAAEATTIVNAADYAQVIRDFADQRRIELVGLGLRHELAVDPGQIAADAIEQLDAIVASRTTTGVPTVTMREAAARAIDAAAQAYQRDGAIPGISWGLRDLDTKTLGMQPGELIVLAGRPGMGKTAVALGVLRSAAKAGHKCAMFSLEMGDIQITTRMIADEIYASGSEISYWAIQAGRMSEKEFEKIADATTRLAELPITIEQQPGISVQQIAARARQMKRRGGLDLLVVDHLTLVRPSERYKGHRVEEIGEITRGLKGLAKELGIPVLALCQLSRGVEGREDKRPTLADLRGSGDIEQDSDVVAMLYRESYYLERRKPAEHDADEFGKWMAALEKCHRRLDILLEKQRQGPVGVVPVFCNIGCNAVRDLARDDMVPSQESFL